MAMACTAVSMSWMVINAPRLNRTVPGPRCPEYLLEFHSQGEEAIPMNQCREKVRYFCLMFSFAAFLTFMYSEIEAAPKDNQLPDSGRGLYAISCAACHGVDGTGAPKNQVGFDLPLPDFTDCDFAAREPNLDWRYVTAEGGPARGFSRLMPAFGDMLTNMQVKKILDHIRTFCRNKNWPRGELNLPLALVTTKAFPEDELVLFTEVNTHGRNEIKNELIYEQRFGARNNFELIFPFGWSEQLNPDAGDISWKSSVGDIGIGVKRVLYHSLENGAILSLGGEVFFPTGDEDEGFGSGTTMFEPYLAYGQLLPADFFAQFQAGMGLPFDSDKASEEAFWRGLLGRSFFLGKYGRICSPMVEFLGSKELVSDAETHWDAVPQFQVSLNRRQHVRLGIGARIPLNDSDTRETVYSAYVLWDWFDGGFFEGW